MWVEVMDVSCPTDVVVVVEWRQCARQDDCQCQTDEAAPATPAQVAHQVADDVAPTRRRQCEIVSCCKFRDRRAVKGTQRPPRESQTANERRENDEKDDTEIHVAPAKAMTCVNDNDLALCIMSLIQTEGAADAVTRRADMAQ